MYKQDNIGIFPSFLKLPVRHGFSWGEDAPNMSDKIGDPNITEERVEDFFRALNIPAEYLIVGINPSKNQYKDPNMLEINKSILDREFSESGEIQVGANFIFTSLSDVVLTVKPGDCAICVLYFESETEKYVGLIHCSAEQTDNKLPLEAINYLIRKYSIKPENIKVGITPAISKDSYFVKEGKFDLDNWHGFMEKKGDKIYLDILGNILNQLSESKVPNENVEYYNIDTFSAAMQGQTFSHSLSSLTDLPEGRYLVAINLISS